MKKYDRTYCEWLNAVHEFSYDIFEFVIDSFKDSNINSCINKKINIFLESYFNLESRLKGIQQRVLIELRKIDELV